MKGLCSGDTTFDDELDSPAGGNTESEVSSDDSSARLASDDVGSLLSVRAELQTGVLK